ncbi:hypothetical protein I302_100057 [Kwoniella bestiolae CBS 10118]|uniref:Uncharacterized protein n=1 Tax=Kwoniella bestiolae CBS 10118 TaxID=1296100 RepID=A0A1B9G412_9TREE|nr:hypothetical protein I302_03429 [Kwoniella bestiolae CBS 10118]OCF25756.1 hypothetical protein I302_03429 [Kwoniella bestiolae CBS 10118]
MTLPHQQSSGETTTRPSFNKSNDPNKWDSAILTKFAKKVYDSKGVEGCDPREVSVSNKLFKACSQRDYLEARLAEVNSILNETERSISTDQGSTSVRGRDLGIDLSIQEMEAERIHVERGLVVLYHTFEELDKEADDLVDTLYEEMVTRYTNTLLKDLTNTRYEFIVNAYPALLSIQGLKQAISDTYSNNRSVYAENIRAVLEPMMKYEYDFHRTKSPLSVNLKQNTVNLQVTRGRRNEYSRVAITPSDRERYEGIEPIKTKEEDEPIVDESVVESLAERGFDSRGRLVGGADVSSGSARDE